MQEIKSKARVQKLEGNEPGRKLNLFNSNKFADLSQPQFVMTFELVHEEEENGELVEKVEQIDFLCKRQGPGDTLITSDQGLIMSGIRYNKAQQKLQQADNKLDEIPDEDQAALLLSGRELQDAILLQNVIEPKLTKDDLKVIPITWQIALVEEITKGPDINTELVSSFRAED